MSVEQLSTSELSEPQPKSLFENEEIVKVTSTDEAASREITLSKRNSSLFPPHSSIVPQSSNDYQNREFCNNL